jgi:hypothetical protein
MAWSFSVNFNDGGGAHDITAMVELSTIRRNMALHSALKPTANTLIFQLRKGTTILNSLLTNDNDTDITVTKDAAAYFTGKVRANFEVQVGNILERVKVECIDRSEDLQRKIKDTFVWASYKVCDPSTPASSIVHQLLYLAGFSAGDLSVTTTINKTIDYMVNVPVKEDQTYWDLLTNILFEFGYIWYFGADGKFRLYDFLPATTTPTHTLDNSNIFDRLVIKKKLAAYEGVEVKYYSHRTEPGALVFNDTTGGSGVNPCNISLAPGAYYPTGADTASIFSEYQFEGGEIVTVLSAALSVTKESGIDVVDAFVSYYRRGKFAYKNNAGTAKSITKLQITGDVVYKGDMGKSKCLLVTDSEKLLTIDADWLTTKTDADKLAIGLARYFKYSDFLYQAHSKTVLDLGEFVTLTENTIGLTTTCVVVAIEDMNVVTGERIYQLEGIEEYSAESVTAEGNHLQPPPPAPGTGPTVGPTYTEIITGFVLGGGTMTPTPPTIAICKAVGTKAILLTWDRQLNLTNFDHYEIQVSSDNSTWYSLKFDGTDWKDALGADTEVLSEFLVHSGIPHGGTAEAPTGVLLYYRVRRVTKAAVESSWSTAASATSRTVAAGDLAADSIYANNIIAAQIVALLLRAATLWVGYAGTGTYNSPDEGDRRIYLDGDEIKFQIYTAGAWSSERQIALGGADGSGNFLPFLACRGLLGDMDQCPAGDPSPAGILRLFQFDNNRLDQNGVDPWTVIFGTFDYSSAVKWQGTYSLHTAAAMLNAWFAGGWVVGDSVTACFMIRIDDDQLMGHDLFEWGASSDSDYINIELSGGVKRRIDIRIKKGGTTTDFTSASAFSQSAWHFICFTYVSSTNTAYLRIDSTQYSFQPTGTWGSGTKSIFMTLIGGASYDRYIDDLLFSANTAMDPDLFFQHVTRSVAWTTAYAAEDLLLAAKSGGTVRALSGLTWPMLYIEDQKAAGTHGGTSVAGAWTQRDLNTVLTNSISGASLASNRITLPAGTYFVEASAPAHRADNHKLKLYNYTDSADVPNLMGTSEQAAAADNSTTRSFVKGVFTLAAEKTVELRHRVVTATATFGFGVASNFAVVEVYSQIEIRKIA